MSRAPRTLTPGSTRSASQAMLDSYTAADTQMASIIALKYIFETCYDSKVRVTKKETRGTPRSLRKAVVRLVDRREYKTFISQFVQCLAAELLARHHDAKRRCAPDRMSVPANGTSDGSDVHPIVVLCLRCDELDDLALYSREMRVLVVCGSTLDGVRRCTR